jgi:hypothetical protein
MKFVTDVSILVSIIVATAVALFAAYRLIAGMPLTVVPEVPEGTSTPPTVVAVTYAPYPAAMIPLCAALLLIVGLLIRKLWLVWTGWLILSVFSGLFLFSSGALLLPAAALLLVLLVVFTANWLLPPDKARRT